MNIAIRKFSDNDLPSMIDIWNEVVNEANAFPQIEELNEKTARDFFGSQSLSSVAVDENNNVLGLYILHPNNIGRCGHICNASYAVKNKYRGNNIGKALVLDSLIQGKALGFLILQFNAVVAFNTPARKLYESLGFIQLGTVKNGYKLKDGTYTDICPYYKSL